MISATYYYPEQLPMVSIDISTIKASSIRDP